MDFWWIFSAKLRAKLTKKSIIWLLVGKFAEIVKKLKNLRKSRFFGLPAFEAKFNKKRPKTDQNSSKNLVSILIQFLMDFGGQLGSKILPKPGQNRGQSMKDELPNQ